ncbi:cation efflux protein [Crucibulum laeve]|uniref:Cation efflux protein n=1 Tax=Crucibulum laeve TaxID=68775 RepID=A0A5C3M8R6_9AGAR|nr:cation efflux protein [Crucibulum laeve]
MGMSRSARITLLLLIDVVFFFVELIAGYAVGSLALVADSFHMLNDVMSLLVALYAIKLTAANATDSRYSYGWHRAEILAALVNGVFLLALCFSISLEALERFFTTPDISNPKLIVIVGSLGLASNIVGLFLFHEHGHAHGHGHSHSPAPSKPPSVTSDSRAASITGDTTPTQKQTIRGRSRSPIHSPTESFSSLYGHPAATRASLVQTAHDIASARSPSPTARRTSFSQVRRSYDATGPSLETQSRHIAEGFENVATSASYSSEGTPLLHDEPGPLHEEEHHHGHSHSHAGSMNMRALVLHVLGDALGNVGVIATGLVIWLTEWTFKYYFDPIISLVITVIIFSSALPLVRSTSFILLQGVPSTVSLEEVKDAILAVDGVLSLHELHVWQLSETKIVASVHVLASRRHDFMPVAAKIRKALHHLGIHSSTIQPEYYHPPTTGLPDDHLKTTDETSCLILCPPDQACDPAENSCCPPPTVDV